MKKYKCPNCGNIEFETNMLCNCTVHCYVGRDGKFQFVKEIYHEEGDLDDNSMVCRNCNIVIRVPELTVG